VIIPDRWLLYTGGCYSEVECYNGDVVYMLIGKWL